MHVRNLISILLKGAMYSNCAVRPQAAGNHIHNSPKCLQRMHLHLQNYDIQVEYKKGETTFLADTLSRTYLENELVSQTQDSDVGSIRK